MTRYIPQPPNLFRLLLDWLRSLFTPKPNPASIQKPPMSTHTFFWHDYETFGLSPRTDRPSQFAGIRTDSELNEIGAPLMVYCQPPGDYVPSAESTLITGITPQYCAQQGVPEHQFAAQVHAALSEGGTVGVGYNTIRFDDEFTRHLLWRNLYDPYGREWQNRCGRWDLLDVLRAYRALRPDGIVWPTAVDTKNGGTYPSLKLTDLTTANGIAHEGAHDALSDVRATIAMARLARNANPKLFDACFALHKKDAVSEAIGLIGAQGKPFVHISKQYPAERGNIALVWPLAAHPTNKNEIIVWDLSADPRELAQLTPDDVKLRLFTKTEDLPAGVTRLPIKTIHINKSPMVFANLKVLSPEQAAHWGVDVNAAHANAAHMAALLVSQNLWPLWESVFAAREFEPDDNVDHGLYQGFIGNEDKRILERLRALSPADLAATQPVFKDARLTELLLRYRARNFPAYLTTDETAEWAARCAAIKAGQVDNPGINMKGLRSVAALQAEIDTLSANATAAQRGLMQQVLDYANGL